MELSATSAFSSIVGHSLQLKQLTTALNKKCLPHALLFAGPQGIGKRRIAQELAFQLLTIDNSNLEKENSYKLLNSGQHPDLHVVETAEGVKGITVDSIRTLTAELRLKPYLAKKRIAIIDQAHTMNVAAANAFLMTLEEPGEDSHIILLSDAPQRILPTIISRTQNMHFGELQSSEITEVLKQLLPETTENPKFLEAILKIAYISLAPLELSPFINPYSLVVENKKKCLEHLKQLVLDTHKLDKQLDSFFFSERSSIRSALALASELGSSKEHTAIAWRSLRKSAQAALKKAESKTQRNVLANTLLKVIEAEHMTNERNLNMTLQLSEVLLERCKH